MKLFFIMICLLLSGQVLADSPSADKYIVQRGESKQIQNIYHHSSSNQIVGIVTTDGGYYQVITSSQSMAAELIRIVTSDNRIDLFIVQNFATTVDGQGWGLGIRQLNDQYFRIAPPSRGELTAHVHQGLIQDYFNQMLFMAQSNMASVRVRELQDELRALKSNVEVCTEAHIN